MDNDRITSTLVRIKTKQHIFFSAYKTNSSSPITKNKTKNPHTNKKDQFYSCMATVSTSSFVQVISVLTKRTSWCCGSRDRQTLESRQAGRRRQEIRKTQGQSNIKLYCNATVLKKYIQCLTLHRNTFT